jgi:hypothetical protein
MKSTFLFCIFHLLSLNFAADFSSIYSDDEIDLNQSPKQLRSKDEIFKELPNIKIPHPSIEETNLPTLDFKDVSVSKDAVPNSIRHPFNRLLYKSISSALEINWNHVAAFLEKNYLVEGEIQNCNLLYRNQDATLCSKGIDLFQFLKVHFVNFKIHYPTLKKGRYIFYKFTFHTL